MWPSPDKLCQNAGNPVGPSYLMDLTGLVMEPKLDGFRLLTHIDSSVTPYTRTGKSQAGKIPHIEAALSTLPAGTWLDGELVYLDDKGFPIWGEVQSRIGSNAGDVNGELTYVVFDILSYAGLDVRPLPLSDRRTALKSVVEALDGEIMIAEQVPASHSWHDEIIAKGMEGSIVKDPSKAYASGKRGHGWTKLKATDEVDVVIMGFKPGENSFSGLIGAIEFGQYKLCDKCKGKYTSYPVNSRAMCSCYVTSDKAGWELSSRGRCSGMDMKTRQWFTKNQQESIGTVVSVAYMGMMGETLRHPQFKRIRPDKLATDCEWS